MNRLFKPAYLLDVVKISFGSLMRHRMRSLLSVLGVVGGVAAVFATLSIGEGAKREVLAGIRGLGLENVILKSIVVPETQRRMGRQSIEGGLQITDVPVLAASSPDIVTVSYLREVPVGFPDLNMKFRPQLVAVSASYLSVQGLHVKKGRFLRTHDEKGKALVCVLGESLAKNMGRKGRVGEQIRIGNQLFLIVGILKGNGTDVREGNTGVAATRDVGALVCIPFGVHEYLGNGRISRNRNALDEITIKVTHERDVERLVPLIRRTMDLLHQGSHQYEMVVPRQLMLQAKKTQGIFNLILASIGGISLVVGGIGIMNVLLATVSERTREIGIRRAVGATREDIVAQFLVESILLTAAGGVIGIFAGLSFSWSIANFAQWHIAVSWVTVLVPLLTSVAVGICAGLYPAVKAGRMDPIQALRSA